MHEKQRNIRPSDTASSRELGATGIGSLDLPQVHTADRTIDVKIPSPEIPQQLKRIITEANHDGYQALLRNESLGLVEIVRNGEVEFRARLGQGHLAPGKWEAKLATVFAQIQMSRLSQKYADEFTRWAIPEGAPGYLSDGAVEIVKGECKRTLGIPDNSKIQISVGDFPGGRSISVHHGNSVVASLSYSARLNLALEFRILPAFFT